MISAAQSHSLAGIPGGKSVNSRLKPFACEIPAAFTKKHKAADVSQTKTNQVSHPPNPWVATFSLSLVYSLVSCTVRFGSVAVLFRSVASEASAEASVLLRIFIWRVFLEMINPQQTFGAFTGGALRLCPGN
jgi:hypothetical protein